MATPQEVSLIIRGMVGRDTLQGEEALVVFTRQAEATVKQVQSASQQAVMSGSAPTAAHRAQQLTERAREELEGLVDQGWFDAAMMADTQALAEGAYCRWSW